MPKDVNLTQQLKRLFGFDKFKGDQEAIIRNLLAGKDTFVLMPTGGGKSLCYQLPSLLMEGTAIVISPLIALMKNQVDVINGMSEEEGVAHYLNSSLNKAAIDQVKADITAGKTKLLYVAPESLNKDDNVEFLQTVKISFYAIDEAHCISEWGHDFRPEYRNIRPTIQRIGNAPVIALTATATDKVRTDIKKNLGIVDAKEFNSSFNRPNLYYEVRPKTNDINKQIIRFIKQNPGKSGIVYCLSRKKVEELAADDTIKRQDVRGATEVRASASLSIPTRTCRNWRSSWRENRWQSRISEDNCSRRRLPMPSHRCAGEKCCSTISVRNTTRKIVATATTACIPRPKWRERMNCSSYSRRLRP